MGACHSCPICLVLDYNWVEKVNWIEKGLSTFKERVGHSMVLRLQPPLKGPTLIFFNAEGLPGTMSPRRRSVFKDLTKLDFNYIPEKLVHRERQLQRLDTLFNQVITDQLSQNVLLTGSVGTGKTAMSKLFCTQFQARAKSSGKRVEYVFVNCRQRNTEASVMLKVVNHFQPRFPDRGFSITEMQEILRKDIKKNATHLIIVLDEADILLKKAGSDLIYGFSRFDEESPAEAPRSISLMLISQENIFEILDAASVSTFKRSNLVKFEGYDADELFDILEARVGLAFHNDTVDIELIALISDIASENGDARYGIELLEMAGHLADENKSEALNAEYVRAAKAETFSTVTKSQLAELDLQRKLFLIATARALKKKAYAGTGDVEKIYAVVCEEYNESARGHTQFWKYIKDLDANGLISTRKSGKGFVGTTTLISLPDIPASELEKMLLKMIE